MDYTYAARYNQFLLEEFVEQQNMNRYIHEAVILAEGGDTFSKLQSLNEGFGEKVKELWNKFVGFVKRIFGKFSEAMNKVLDTDKGYLDKYKDIILKKPIKFTEVKMRKYNLKGMTEAQVPLFNYGALQAKLTDKGVFMESIIPAFGTSKGSVDDMSGWCKAYFCGGSEDLVEIKPSEINMTDLFNYCYDFKAKTMVNIKKDQDNIINSANNAQNLINQAIKDQKAAEDAVAKAKEDEAKKNAETNNQNQPASGGSTETRDDGRGTVNVQSSNSSAMLFTDPVTYSTIYEGYFTEAEVKTDANKPGTGTTGAVVDNDKKFSTNVSNSYGDAENKDSATAAVSNGLTEDKVNSAITVYSSVTQAIMGAKLTVSEWAYKEYMQVIRAHVKGYVGTDDNKSSIPPMPTNYQPPDGAPDPNGQEIGSEFKDKQGAVWKIGEALNSAGQKVKAWFRHNK